MGKAKVARQIKTRTALQRRMAPAQDGDKVVVKKGRMPQGGWRGGRAPEGKVQCALGQLLEGRGPDGQDGHHRPRCQVLQPRHQAGQDGLGGKIAGSKAKAGPVEGGVKGFGSQKPLSELNQIGGGFGHGAGAGGGH